MKTVVVTIRLTPAQARLLKRRADAERRSVSGMARVLIEDALKENGP